MTIRDMQNIDDLVNCIVEDISEVPDDTKAEYEVWAIGYDEEGSLTPAELLLATFDDPDQAVHFAKLVTLADVIHLAAEPEYADDTCTEFDCSAFELCEDCSVPETVHHISIEVETVIPDDDDGTMNIGTVYKRTLEMFEEVPDFVCLSNDDYTIIEETSYIQIPRHLVKEYDKDEVIVVLFEEEEKPWPIELKIISKTEDYYICDFV